MMTKINFPFLPFLQVILIVLQCPEDYLVLQEVAYPIFEQIMI